MPCFLLFFKELTGLVWEVCSGIRLLQLQLFSILLITDFNINMTDFNINMTDFNINMTDFNINMTDFRIKL